MCRSFHLLMRVECGIQGPRDSEPWPHFVGCLVTEQRIANRTPAIIGRRFRIKSDASLDEPTLSKILRRQTTDEEHHRGARTRASRVHTHVNAFQQLLPTPQRLQRKALFLHRNVVLEFLQLQHRAAPAICVQHFHGAPYPNTILLLNIAVANPPHQLVLSEVLNLNHHIVVFADHHHRRRVLGRLALLGFRLDLPTRLAVESLFPLELVIELIHIALFQIFKTKICPEKSCGAILQCDTPVALQRRCPHPLIGSPILMIDDQQRHALHLGRRRESQNSLTSSIRPDALEHPALQTNLVARSNHLKRPLILLRFGQPPLLRLRNNLPGILGLSHDRDENEKRETRNEKRFIHTPTPQPASRAPPTPPAQSRRQTRRPILRVPEQDKSDKDIRSPAASRPGLLP